MLQDLTVPLDRIRLAERSRRCFLLGVIGAAPILGLPAAWEVLRLFRLTREETGERWKHWPFMLSFAAGWIFLTAARPLVGWTWTLGLFYLELGLLGWMFTALYRKARGSVENPLRRWLYGGVALVYLHLFVLGTTGVFAWQAFRAVVKK